MSADLPARLRVAIFTETYLPYLSGVTVSTEALARGLGAAAHDVLLVAPRPSAPRPAGPTIGLRGPEPKHAWLPSYELPRVAPPGYRMPLPWAFGASIVRAIAFRPHVIHAQSPFVTGLLARWVARHTDRPLVFTHHTRFADYGHYLGPLAVPGGWLTDTYLRSFWAGCSAIVAPSSDLAADLRARLAELRHRPVLRVVPTGIDLQAVEALPRLDPRPMAGWPPDSLVVAHLGRLAQEKSVDVVIDAVAAAAATQARLRLLLVGDGPSTDVLRARVTRLGIEDRVFFAGRRERTEALSLLKGSDLFAFASATETQGIVLAEALASGLPVVTLEGPGVRDSARDGIDAVVVARTAGRAPAARLGEAIASLAADDERRARMAAAALAGARRFDLAQRITEIVALYRALVARG